MKHPKPKTKTREECTRREYISIRTNLDGNCRKPVLQPPVTTISSHPYVFLPWFEERHMGGEHIETRAWDVKRRVIDSKIKKIINLKCNLLKNRGKSKLFKLYYLLQINMFIIVKKIWVPYITNNPHILNQRTYTKHNIILVNLRCIIIIIILCHTIEISLLLWFY